MLVRGREFPALRPWGLPGEREGVWVSLIARRGLRRISERGIRYCVLDLYLAVSGAVAMRIYGLRIADCG